MFGTIPHTGYFGELCTCPICCEGTPERTMNLYSPIAPNGMWVGPHCMCCEYRLRARLYTEQEEQERDPELVQAARILLFMEGNRRNPTADAARGIIRDFL